MKGRKGLYFGFQFEVMDHRSMKARQQELEGSSHGIHSQEAETERGKGWPRLALSFLSSPGLAACV